MTHDATQTAKTAVHTSLFGIGIVLIGANLRAPITAIGPVPPAIQITLGLSESQAGAFNSLPLFIFAALSLVAPAAGRRFGVERLLGIALLAIAGGVTVRSSGDSVAVWVGTVLLSIGIAFANVLLPGLVKREMPSKAPTLIALYAAAMAAAAGLAAGLAVPISHVAGSNWRWSLGLWAGLAVVAFVVWLPQWGHTLHSPATTRHGIPSARSPWKDTTGWAVALFFAAHSGVFYAIVTWYPSYAMTKGTSLTGAGCHLLLYQVVAVVSNIACGPLIKKSTSQVGLGAFCGALLLIGTTGLLMNVLTQPLWIVILGLGAGMAMTTSLSLFGLRTSDHEQASRLSGMAQFIGYMGAAAGPFFVGLLRQTTQGWAVPWAALCVASLCVMVFGALAGRNRKIR